MPTSPLVSIILHIPHVETSLNDLVRSCVTQSLTDLEIICLVSTSAVGVPLIDETAEMDPRLRIIQQPHETSAFRAHRTGALSATAPYVLFVESGSELDHAAAATLLETARAANADVVGFRGGIKRVDGPLRASISDSARSAPAVHDDAILRALFAEPKPLDFQMGHYLFRTDLLRATYRSISQVSAEEVLEDGSAFFLACAAAATYVSLPNVLCYRHPSNAAGEYNSRQSEIRAALGVIDSLAAIGNVVQDRVRNSYNPESLIDAYESIRISAVGDTLKMLRHVSEKQQREVVAQLRSRVRDVDLISAAATFAPRAMGMIGSSVQPDVDQDNHRPVRNVLLATDALAREGAASVVLAQARALLAAGYKVTIATHLSDGDAALAPTGATLARVDGATARERLIQWDELCRWHEIDVVIDYRILHTRDWPAYALTARAHRVATVGWLDNFSGYPTLRGEETHSRVLEHVDFLDCLVVPSPLDVAFWKMRGIEKVVYMPGPPSSVFERPRKASAPKRAPVSRRVELLWWGCLNDETDQVTQVVDAASALRSLGVDYRLHVVGPDSAAITAGRLSSLIAKRGLEGLVSVFGHVPVNELIELIDSADILIGSSISDGYAQNAFEAQSRGLPVVMYDLPWIPQLQDNPGVVTVDQGAATELAHAIYNLVTDPQLYEAVSRATTVASVRATPSDYASLFAQLVSGGLPPQYSPEPMLEDGRELLRLLTAFAAKSAARKPAPIAVRPRKQPRSRKHRGQSHHPRATSFGPRLERKLTPVGRSLIHAFPWIRPIARRIKVELLRH